MNKILAAFLEKVGWKTVYDHNDSGYSLLGWIKEPFMQLYTGEEAYFKQDRDYWAEKDKNLGRDDLKVVKKAL